MQDNNVAAPAPADNSTPASSPPMAGSFVNRRKERVLTRKSVPFAGETQPGDPPPAPVLDAALNDDDVRISISVNLYGRSINLMEDCEFTSLICGGLAPENRGILFSMVDRLINGVEEGIGARVNAAVPTRQSP